MKIRVTTFAKIGEHVKECVHFEEEPAKYKGGYARIEFKGFKDEEELRKYFK